MKFTTVAHFNGIFSHEIDLIDKNPWIYVIVVLKSKLLYIGETYDQGLVIRLSQHFGAYTNSSLKKRALDHGFTNLYPPFLIIAAQLPSGEEVDFDANSKRIRLVYEALLHQKIAERFTGKNAGWLTASTCNPQNLRASSIESACDSITSCFINSINFLESLVQVSPFQLILLDQEIPRKSFNPDNIGELLQKTEISLFQYILKVLEDNYGKDSWWSNGIPKNIRQQCQMRKEDENIVQMQPEAYLTLIDFRDIIKQNWTLFISKIEKIAEKQGKDKATSWMVELNEARKLWAHPIKQKYLPFEKDKVSEIEKICKKIEKILLS